MGLGDTSLPAPPQPARDTPLPGLAGRIAPKTLGGVLGFALAYGLVHSLARLGASRNLGEREPIENIYAQTLAGGYSPDQLPLYDWLVWGLQQVLGPGVVSFLVLKYSLLLALAGFMFLVARRVTGSPQWAFVAVEAMALVYQIFWRLHETHTHLIGALVLSLAALWAVMRCVDRQRWGDYAVLAVVVGLGCLTQLTFPLFMLALACACLWQPAVRQRLFTRKLLAALPLTLLCIAPYIFWLMQAPGRLDAFVASMPAPAWAETGAPPLIALWESIQTPLLALSPYLLFLFLIFPRVFSALFAHCRERGTDPAAPDWTRVITYTVLLEWGVFVIVSVVYGLQRYSVQDLLVFFLIAIVALTDGARRSSPPEKAKQRYMRLAVLISVIALLVRLAHMYIHEPICKTCRWGEPYAALADSLRAEGFQGGSIVTNDAALGGNLRAHFPSSRIILSPQAELPASCTARTCILTNPGKARTDAPAGAKVVEVNVPWKHLWKPTGYRTSTWWYEFPPPAGEQAQ